jgi:hypothetical protein
MDEQAISAFAAGLHCSHDRILWLDFGVRFWCIADAVTSVWYKETDKMFEQKLSTVSSASNPI